MNLKKPVDDIKEIRQIKNEVKLALIDYLLDVLKVLPTLCFDKFNGHFTSGKICDSYIDLFKFENTRTTKECSFLATGTWLEPACDFCGAQRPLLFAARCLMTDGFAPCCWL